LSLIKGTSCSIFGLKDKTIDRIVEETKSYISGMGLPENYTVDVRKDKVVCCGNFLFGVAFEVKGPKMKTIKDVEKKIVDEIQNICKKESVECQGCASDGILLDIKGSVFDQDEP
jgi:hypothetical protein